MREIVIPVVVRTDADYKSILGEKIVNKTHLFYQNPFILFLYEGLCYV